MAINGGWEQALIGGSASLAMSAVDFRRILKTWAGTNVRPPELQLLPVYIGSEVTRFLISAVFVGFLGSDPAGLALAGFGAFSVIERFNDD